MISIEVLQENLKIIQDSMPTVEQAAKNINKAIEVLNRRSWLQDNQPPQKIQGYTAEQWQDIIDGGYLCEFSQDIKAQQWVKNQLTEVREITTHNFVTNVVTNGANCYKYCRPAQIKGVMRPIFVEPSQEAMRDATFVFFDKHGNSVRDGQAVWNYSIGSPIITKYIEV